MQPSTTAFRPYPLRGIWSSSRVGDWVPSPIVIDRPPYIAFEGAEGCGKSTQAARLAAEIGALEAALPQRVVEVTAALDAKQKEGEEDEGEQLRPGVRHREGSCAGAGVPMRVGVCMCVQVLGLCRCVHMCRRVQVCAGVQSLAVIGNTVICFINNNTLTLPFYLQQSIASYGAVLFRCITRGLNKVGGCIPSHPTVNYWY